MPASPETMNAIRDYYTKLKVSNLSQPNDYTCQATCIAMALDYTTANQIKDIYHKLKGLDNNYNPGSPLRMATVIHELLKAHSDIGYQLYYDQNNACLDDVKTWLEEGDFLITHGCFTHSGHVICLSGLEIDTENNSYKLEVKDPWSEFDAPNWRYDLGGDLYDGYYSSYCIYAACVASSSYGDAKIIYNNGELDSSYKNMWVHRFMLSKQKHGGGSSIPKTYVVQSGDTLSGIASRFGISLGALEAANPQITNPNVITPGESLNIPES